MILLQQKQNSADRIYTVTYPNQFKSKSDKKKAGRHKDEDLHNGFLQLCDWLDQQDGAYTVKELEEKMKTLTESAIVTALNE